ncbi:TIM44-like domain-containing protein [Granulosicoccaceae sp. 1_MG-2023]|nr:TIM44-like domain-containing protein [Granulosicoccaceae sp. 1_MG-2023]
MKSLFPALMVALFSVALFASGPVEAKRLGGGGSFGKSYSYSRTPAKPAPAQNTTQQANKSGAAAAAGSRGMMGGMLGGLLAGSLLGALFFGGAFDGLQFMDILVFGLLAFLAFKLFQMFRGQNARQQPAMAGAASGPQFGGAAPASGPAAPASGHRFAVPEIGSGLKGQPLSAMPAWFDEARFMSNVETHFRDLQRIWDSGDFSELKDYVTPAMYVHLREQHDALTEKPVTEVISLQSQLLDLLEDGDDVVAAIHFTGILRENGIEESISEVWHVRHPKDDATADWKLDGIAQLDQ